MIEVFTVEEINLICVFGVSSRKALIGELVEFSTTLLDRSMLEICFRATDKLAKLTDAEFAALEFYPEDEDEDDDFYFSGNNDNDEEATA